MPVYEYRCAECGEITSLIRSVSEHEPEATCEHCSGRAMRILSTPSVHLSRTSKLEKLDPKYDKMVDKAMRGTQNAEPDRVLDRVSKRTGREETGRSSPPD